MGVMNSPKRAKERGKEFGRGFNRMDLQTAERRLTSNMAAHPPVKQPAVASQHTPPARVNSASPLLDDDMPEVQKAAAELPPSRPRKTIVSIHGRDVDPEELDKHAA